ncbi:MAG: 3-hydroxyacyl-ACP dehydratase [Maribacter sp.]|nr:3-hydroxyacyl-ACP dehydratase [Maribacter sp.]
MLIKGLYTIKTFELNRETIEATIELHKEHPIFKGHFPGNPVMPGVCMIQIIKELTEKALDKNLFLSAFSNIKFMAIINPEIHAFLKLDIALTETDTEVKVKNTSFFGDTLALKLNATFKILG